MSLVEAIKKGELSQVRELATKESVALKDRNGNSPLHHAADKGDLNILYTILACNPKVDERNNSQETPLMIAVTRQHEAIVNALLEKDVDPNLADNFGYNSMHKAACANNLSIMKKLEDHNGDIKAIAKDGATIMHCAAIGVTQGNEDWKLTEWLLKKGASYNAIDFHQVSVKDTFNDTDLSYGARYEKLVEALGLSVVDITTID